MTDHPVVEALSKLAVDAGVYGTTRDEAVALGHLAQALIRVLEAARIVAERCECQKLSDSGPCDFCVLTDAIAVHDELMRGSDD